MWLTGTPIHRYTSTPTYRYTSIPPSTKDKSTIKNHTETSVVNPSPPPGPRPSTFAPFPHSVEAPDVNKIITGVASLRHITVVSRTCFPLGHSPDIPVCKLSHSPVHPIPIVTPGGHSTVGISIPPTPPCTTYGALPGTAIASGNITATDTTFLLCCGEGPGHHGSVNNTVTLTGLTIGSPSYDVGVDHMSTPRRLPGLRSTGPSRVLPAKIIHKFFAK